MTAPAPLHDAAYLARILDKTENWVARNAHRFPHVRVGRSYRFSDEDVAAIIEQLRHRPAPSRQGGGSRPITRRRAS